MNLENIRKQIDKIDNVILKLLNERMDLVNTVGQIKNATSTPIYRPQREKQIVSRLQDQNKGRLNNESIEAIFTQIFAVSRNIESPQTVAYLGPEGSFTHQAAQKKFGKISKYQSMPSIKSLFDQLQKKNVKLC